MLVLTRKAGQSIVIGDDIEVILVAVEGSKVRLGIRAPSSVPVHRMEIYLEIHASDHGKADLESEHLYDAPRRQAS